MSAPKKMTWYCGTNGLGFILDQERKHWLLKTDKNKQVQDDETGDLFKGQIDNRGSEVVIASEKSDYKTSILSDILFSTDVLNELLVPAYSAFTYTSEANGLMFGRIKSMSYPVNDEITDGVNYQNYRITFTDAEEIIIPFAASTESDEVYATKWIKTTTAPKIQTIDGEGIWRNATSIGFKSNVTGLTYYYPLDANMCLLTLHLDSPGNYHSDAVISDQQIGYPLFWFTCNQSKTGPNTFITNNTSLNGTVLMHFGNEGTDSNYNGKLYVGVDGNMDATPDDSSSSDWYLAVYAQPGSSFDDSSGDYSRNIDKDTMEFINPTTSETHAITFDDSSMISSIRMNPSVPWTYVDETKYVVQLSDYDVNCADLARNPLVPALDVYWNSSIPFTIQNSMNLGYAGIKFSSSPNSDQSRYPYSLNEWDGLPEWLNNIEDNKLTPEHMAIYAIHNTPFYNDADPQSRQVAALLFDPGKQVEESSMSLAEDEKGRIYVLSNDSIEYENNAKLENPKPARTLARICDIPTSVSQFINVEGIVPVSVVDNKYVRCETPFYEKDADRLYNVLGTRVIVPTMVDSNHHPITDSDKQNNDFIFDNTIVNNLVKVNLLMPENDTRYYTNLSPTVDISHLETFISDSGSMYREHDLGIIIVGGACYEYEITEATPIVDNTGGAVISMSVMAHDIDNPVSLSNFDLRSDQLGYTESCLTVASNGEGSGLSVYFYIDNLAEIQMKQDRIRENMIAFVNELDGLYLYTFYPNSESQYGEYYYNDQVDWGRGWKKTHLISKKEINTTERFEYDNKGNITGETTGTSAKVGFLNTTLPSYRPIPINRTDEALSETTLDTISTASMINIIDKDYTPLITNFGYDDLKDHRVDICGFKVTEAKRAVSTGHTLASVLETIKDIHDGIYDSYLIWKWVDDSESPNTFEYAFIYNKFSNTFTNEKETYIPQTGMRYASYINTNANTSVVWDIPKIGPMMWTYDSTYKKHEQYDIDVETFDLSMSYTNNAIASEMEWEDFRVQTRNGNLKIVADGKLTYNILSNRIGDNLDYHPRNNEPIYQQPEYTTIGEVNANVTDVSKPCGNWRLVFPRINVYKLKSEKAGVTHAGTQLRMLQVVKGRDLNRSTIGSVTDANGNDVSKKCVIFNETSNGTQMLVYNDHTDNWNTI